MANASDYAQPRHRNKPETAEAEQRPRASEQHDGLGDAAPPLEPEASGGKWHPSTNTPEQQQPAKTTEQILADAIDVSTKQSVDRLDGLIAKLAEMKSFLQADAERVKAELLGHVAVRDKAKALAESIQGEITVMADRIGANANG
jgi:hypothetical protein